ncbi:hypothetical protein, partial [Levilactobacillus hammesii]|uniref:hypothetical protein n=1 Tax=Levilactobacillus hammesii TaxID=267633 RepID=UPI001F231842
MVIAVDSPLYRRQWTVSMPPLRTQKKHASLFDSRVPNCMALKITKYKQTAALPFAKFGLERGGQDGP